MRGDAMQMLVYLGAGGGLGIAAILRQIRLYLRDKEDRRLFRHMFDQTRATDGGDGYTRFVHERSRPLIERKPTESESAASGPPPGDE
jgi:hypothetical protein